MRKFVGEVRRCEELERKLRYIEEEMAKDGVVLDAPRDVHHSALNPRDVMELEVVPGTTRRSGAPEWSATNIPSPRPGRLGEDGERDRGAESERRQPRVELRRAD